jgi:hypothetical protein
LNFWIKRAYKDLESFLQTSEVPSVIGKHEENSVSAWLRECLVTNLKLNRKLSLVQTFSVMNHRRASCVAGTRWEGRISFIQWKIRSTFRNLHNVYWKKHVKNRETVHSKEVTKDMYSDYDRYNDSVLVFMRPMLEIFFRPS